LADRAGISATWCAWIEQGREVRASPEALGRLARALELTRAERAYLFELAGRRDPAADDRPEAEGVPASLDRLMTGVSLPAYGLDRLWNACLWNAAAQQIFEGWLTPGADRNLLRFVFLSAAARGLILDWEARARRILAEFRADYSQSVRDPAMQALVEELRSKSADFDTAWRQQAVLDREGGERLFRHPTRGVLRFEQHTFRPSDRPDYKFVLLSPVPGGDVDSSSGGVLR
jgi:transcriptional regulator with XRE-family HTH domain